MKRALRILLWQRPTWRRLLLLIALAFTGMWLGLGGGRGSPQRYDELAQDSVPPDDFGEERRPLPQADQPTVQQNTRRWYRDPWHPQYLESEFVDHMAPSAPCPGGASFDRNTLKSGLMDDDVDGNSLDPTRYSASVLERRTMKAQKETDDGMLHDRTRHVIPRVLVQTGPTRMLTRNLFLAAKNILDNFPGFRYIFFTDEEMQEYVNTHCGDRHVMLAFMSLIPGAFQADLFRYCYLYHDGGVYMDLGFNRLLERRNASSSFVGLEELLQHAERSRIRVITVEDNGLGFLYNAFVVAAPRHNIFKHALDISAERVLGKLYTADTHGGLLPTGPQLFRDAVMHYAFGTDVNLSVVVRDTSDRARVIYPGRVKDVAVIRYQRHLHCLSGTVRIVAGDLGSTTTQVGNKLVDAALQVAPLDGTLFFTKSRRYYAEGRHYFKREHYGTLWDRGAGAVYK